MRIYGRGTAAAIGLPIQQATSLVPYNSMHHVKTDASSFSLVSDGSLSHATLCCVAQWCAVMEGCCISNLPVICSYYEAHDHLRCVGTSPASAAPTKLKQEVDFVFMTYCSQRQKAVCTQNIYSSVQVGSLSRPRHPLLCLALNRYNAGRLCVQQL